MWVVFIDYKDIYIYNYLITFMFVLEKHIIIHLTVSFNFREVQYSVESQLDSRGRNGAKSF